MAMLGRALVRRAGAVAAAYALGPPVYHGMAVELARGARRPEGEVAACSPAWCKPGRSARRHARRPGVRLVVRERGGLAAAAAVGDSIAINGCCLTVVGVDGDELAFEAGAETLQRTNLGRLHAGDRVNLEPSLRLGDALGGHHVTGHIDGVGTVDARDDDGEWCTMWFRARRRCCGKWPPKARSPSTASA